MEMRKDLFIAVGLMLSMSCSFVACSSDDDDDTGETTVVDQDNNGGGSVDGGNNDGSVTVNMKVGETYGLPDPSLDWVSEQPLIAEVSKDGNEIEAQHVGSTRIWGGSYSYNVNVSGVYNTYEDPCLDWGASVSDVTKAMTGYKFYNQTDNGLLYYGRSGAGYYGYAFQNGGLYMSVVYVKSDYAGELVDFLLERYIYVTTDSDNSIGFCNINQDMLVILYTESVSLSGTRYFQVVYVDIKSFAAKTRGVADLSAIAEEWQTATGIKTGEAPVLRLDISKYVE